MSVLDVSSRYPPTSRESTPDCNNAGPRHVAVERCYAGRLARFAILAWLESLIVFEVNALKVTVAKNAGSVVEMDIAADEDEFAAAMNQAYRKIVRDINIPGFRKGKAPRHIVERMIGREALIEEAGMGMMDDLYRRALQQEGITPVSDPEVNVTEVNPIAFHVSVQVYPEVTLGDYQAVRVEPREVNLDEGAIDETIDTLRKNVAEWVDLTDERKPEEGDQVTIDMTVYEGDEVFQEPAVDMPWVLGEAGMFEALEDAIKDMEVGESRELTLAFDEEDETVAPDVRGKTLRYDMTLKGIKVRDLPEVDDELAGKVGGLESVEQLRDEIRKDLLRNQANEARTEVMNEIVNQMAEISEVDVPVAMVDTEIENQLTQMRSRLAQSGMDLETFLQMSNKTEEDVREELREDAQRRVRNSLVLQKVTEEEGLAVTEEDIEAEIDRMTAGMENPERMRSIYQSEYFRERLEGELQDRKITERILEIATEGRGAITGEAAELEAEAEAAEQEEEIIDVEVTPTDESTDEDETEAVAVEAADDETPTPVDVEAEAPDETQAAAVEAGEDEEEAKTEAS
jgi:trigger factor